MTYIKEESVQDVIDRGRRQFWQQEAQKMANAFWFWAVAALLIVPFAPAVAIFPIIAAVLCIVQSFKATERAEGYR